MKFATQKMRLVKRSPESAKTKETNSTKDSSRKLKTVKSSAKKKASSPQQKKAPPKNSSASSKDNPDAVKSHNKNAGTTWIC